MDEIELFIAARMPLTPVPGVEKIRLHLAVPESRVGSLDPDGPAPYWAYRWGGGLALARHLLDHPESVARRTVRDLGCGSGLVAIAAAMAGAASVSAIDIDPRAAVATRLNAAANGVSIAAESGDALAALPDEQVILAGDLFYDPRLAKRSARFLKQCAEAGRDVLIGDPLRAHLPLAALEQIAEIETVEAASRAPVRSGVFRIRRG